MNGYTIEDPSGTGDKPGLSAPAVAAPPAAAILPFVSVVVPTHNRRELLARLLHSLERQEYPKDRYEIIVVHNYTPDGTEEMVYGIAARSALPVRYYRKNFRGPTASRQFGAMHAQGEIVAFVDDDCETSPGWLAAGAARMQPTVGVVQGRTLPHPGQKRYYLEKTVSVTGPTPYFETCNIFYRQAAFRAVGGFSPEFLDRFYGEDTDLGWKVTSLAGYAAEFAEDALVHHEVFCQPLGRWLAEAAHLRIWPYLVKKWPALRRHGYARLFLSRQSAAFNLFLLGAALAVPIHWSMAVLMLPYTVVRFREGGRYRGDPLRLAARLILGLPRAFVTFIALGYGSLQHRSFLL